MPELRARRTGACREPIAPEKWSKKKDPVTRQDLGRNFRALVQFNVNPQEPKANALYFDHGKLGDVIHPNAELIQAGEKIADFRKQNPQTEKARCSVRELIRRNIAILDIWGFLPYLKGAYGMPEPRVPLATHRWLVKNCGRLFWGYDVGEQEGRYLDSYAQRSRKKRPDESDYDFYAGLVETLTRNGAKFKKHLLLRNFFTDRQEAHRDFRRWMKHFETGLHHNLSPVAHTNLFHHLCELDNTRILGAELALVLINQQVAFAFMRGASRQYGLLTFALPSVWTRWGFSYPAKDRNQRYIGSNGTEVGFGTGLKTDLAERLWYLSYMYGISVYGMEAGYFLRPEDECAGGKKNTFPGLSDFGKLQRNGLQWCQKHPDRGVQYNPVAIMLDFHNGWLAPKHCYQSTGEHRLVWGALPYDKGDHQIDNFFRFVFPGYEEGSYHRDNTGDLVPTPCGDIFDVLLSNADPKVLRRYNALVMLGGCRVAGALKRRLKAYVSGGRDLIVSAANIGEPDDNFYGIKLSERTGTDITSRTGTEKFREAKYTYCRSKAVKADVLLQSGSGAPLITTHKYGRGRVIVITPDYWQSDLPEKRKPKIGLASQRVKNRNPQQVFAGRSEFFDERNWDCPYNTTIKKMLVEGKNLAAIEKEVCVHCRVECTNDVSKQCDILTGVKKVLAGYFESFMPFTVEGPPVHYLVNLTKDRKKMIVTLANHSGNRWAGNIHLKNPDVRIRKAKEWLKDEPSGLRRIKIPPRGLKILEITADRPIL